MCCFSVVGEGLLDLRRVENIMSSDETCAQLRKKDVASVIQPKTSVEGSGTLRSRRAMSSILTREIFETGVEVTRESLNGRNRTRKEEEASRSLGRRSKNIT